MSENTKIEYLYRDAGNWKRWNMCIVKGVISKEQQQLILGCLDEGEYFIPHQVGLPEEKFESFDSDMDHPWFELWTNAFSPTTAAPTADICAEDLVKAFLSCKNNWQPEAVYMDIKPSLSEQILSASSRTSGVSDFPSAKNHVQGREH